MGLFDFLNIKKTKKESNQTALPGRVSVDVDIIAPPDKDLEHLTKDGELPWGWHTHAKDFTDRIGSEYSYFFALWLESKNKSPLEHYSALKSFVMYLDDAEQLCKTTGECHEFWFYNCIASKEYIEKRKIELEELTANFDKSYADFEKREALLSDLDTRIIKMLKDNPGILQSDFSKMFDTLIQNDVKEKLYFMAKSGELERIKSGRSYILHYRK